MNFGDLRETVDTMMRDVLADAGFRRVLPGTWIRRRGDELNLIQLQRHSVEALCCVNLGVHFSFLPKAGSEVPLEIDRLELPDCEIKLRLTEHSSANDQWWPLAASSARQLVSIVSNRGLPIFDLYQLNGPIAAMDGKSIESGSLGVLSSMTKVRACLLLARMHEYLGNRDKCVEAATVGIRLAPPMAVGPRSALKYILKRNGQPA